AADRRGMNPPRRPRSGRHHLDHLAMKRPRQPLGHLTPCSISGAEKKDTFLRRHVTDCMPLALLFSAAMRKPAGILALVSILAASCAHVGPSESVIAGPAGGIHVSDGGRGPALPVLFVHGNGANLTQWQGA